jgi:hypothetical protein
VSGLTQVFGWDATDEAKEEEPAKAGGGASRSVTLKKKDADAAKAEAAEAARRAKPPAEAPGDKSGIWGKIRSIFK